jgi:hypothetical protein
MDAGFVVAALGSAAGVLGTGLAGGQIGTSGRPVRLANWFHFDSLRPLAKPVWLSVWRRGCLRLLCGAAIGVLCIGCEQQGTASGIASFKPVFLPVTFVISSDGSISAEGDLSYVTPLGEFSIGAQYSLQQVDNSILVILRDRNRIPPDWTRYIVFVRQVTNLMRFSMAGRKSILPMDKSQSILRMRR